MKIPVFSFILCYNFDMKKIFLYCLIFASIVLPQAYADEMAEDYMDIARSYAVKGDYSGATAYFNRVLGIEPNNQEVKDNIKMLQRFVSPVKKSYAARVSAALDNAMNSKKNGDMTGTLNYIKSASQGSGFLYYNFLGEYYKETKQYHMAIAAFNQALQANPDFTQAHLAVALCHYEMGDYEGVIPPVTRFIYYNQQEDFGYALRAKAYMRMGRFNDAEPEIVTALALNDDIEYKFLKGIILCNKNQYRQAIETLEPLTETLQTSEIYKYIGYAYYGLQDYNNALLNLDKAIILCDDDKELISKYNEVKTKLNTQPQQGTMEENEAEE